jgi:hypothetical protein
MFAEAVFESPVTAILQADLVPVAAIAFFA